MSRLTVPQTPLLAALAGLLVPGAATWSGYAPAPRPPLDATKQGVGELRQSRLCPLLPSTHHESPFMNGP